MAEEYIKRKDAITAFGNYLGATSVRAYVAAEKILSTVPSEDVKPVVHGQWIYEEPNGANSFKGAYYCDQCNQPETFRRNFCPNCGADMRGNETVIS